MGLEQTTQIDMLQLIAEDGQQVSVSDWRGQPVLLVLLRWLG